MKCVLVSVFAAVALTAGAAFSDSGTCPFPDGHWGWGGSYSIHNSSNLVLFNSGSTLLVADWSDPFAPLVLGSGRLSGEPAAIEFDDDIAFIAVHNVGLQIVDLSNPSAPVDVGLWRSDSSPRDVAVDSGYAFVSVLDGGLWIIDVSQPSNPVETGHLDLGPATGAFDVEIVGSYALIAGGDLVVADVSDPARPIEVSRLALDGFAPRLAVDGSTAWLLGGFPDLVAVDISDPLDPMIIGGIDIPELERDLDASDGVVFVTTSSNRMHVVDAADPSRPTLASTVELAGWGWAVEASHRGALVAIGNDGAAAVTMDSPSSTATATTWKPPEPTADAADVAAIDDLLVIADRSGLDGRLRVLDAGNPEKPFELGRTELPGDGQAVALIPGLAVVAHSTFWVDIWIDGGITLVDLTDPTAPTTLGTCHLPEWVTDVVSSDEAAFALHDFGVTVVDLSLPTEPEVVARWQPGTVRFVSVDVDSGIVFAGGSSGELCTADVAVPSAPVHLGCADVTGNRVHLKSLDVNGPLAAAVADSETDTTDRLILLDVSDPMQPVVLANVPASGASGNLTANNVLLFGALAVVSLRLGNGVQIFDVSDPTEPRAIGESSLPSYSSGGLTAAGGRLFVAAGQGGLDSYRLDGCRRPRRSDGRRSIQEENPFSPGHHPVPVN